MLKKEDKIFIAGARGMAGSAIKRHLFDQGYTKIVVPTSSELDCTNQAATFDFLRREKPDCVIIAAARVGGIHANSTYPAQFLYDNISIGSNLIHGSYLSGVKRLLFLGSSCIYPRQAPQPIPEESLLTSALEKTNEAYALAKIACLKMCAHYRAQYGVAFHSIMPTNLYGQGDNYHPENSHVLPGLIRRFHEAKLHNSSSVTVWGTGTPKRELMNVDDLASAILFLLKQPIELLPDWINAGSGEEHTIAELAEWVKEAVGFQGNIVFDTQKPDGTPRKILDSSKLRTMGWTPKISLSEGLKSTYEHFLKETAAKTETVKA